MNRFKFRAWQENAKKGLQAWSWQEMKDTSLNDFFSNSNNRFVIMQYTGLKDKNGKDIFEGDIVKDIFENAFNELFESENYKVEFVNCCWCFIGERINDCRPIESEIDLHNHFYFNELTTNFFDDNGNLKNFEVIGNVFENPELLKEGEK